MAERSFLSETSTSSDGRVEVYARAGLTRALRQRGLLENVPATARATRRWNAAGRSSVAELEIGDQRVVVKRLHHGGALRWLGEQYIGAARLWRTVRIHQRLEHAGVASVRVVFARRRPGLLPGLARLELATALVADARSLRECWEPAVDRGDRRELLVRCGRVIAAMHDAGVLHADLNVDNVLFDDAGRALLLDFEGSRVRPDPSESAREANLLRLLRSMLKCGMRLGGEDARALLAGYDARDPEALQDRLQRRWSRVRWLHRWAWPTHFSSLIGTGTSARHTTPSSPVDDCRGPNP